MGKRPPRCPLFGEVTNSDQLLPYLEHVARKHYNHGLTLAGISRKASACCWQRNRYPTVSRRRRRQKACGLSGRHICRSECMTHPERDVGLLSYFCFFFPSHMSIHSENSLVRKGRSQLHSLETWCGTLNMADGRSAKIDSAAFAKNMPTTTIVTA